MIIRHNIRTYRSDGVVAVVKGRQLADLTLQNHETNQDSADHHEGWRYFIEKTRLKPGIDPREATLLRQQELESRESTEMRETKAIFPPESEP